MRLLRRPLRCRRGASAVEHAILLPVFFLLVMLVIETSWQITVAAGLDQGARRGTRWVSLGIAAPEGMTRQERMAEIVLAATGLPLDAARLTITPMAFPNHSALAVPGAGVPGLGGPDQVVRYVVEYRSSLLVPMVQRLLALDLLTYRSVFVVQNEPFPG